MILLTKTSGDGSIWLNSSEVGAWMLVQKSNRRPGDFVQDAPFRRKTTRNVSRLATNSEIQRGVGSSSSARKRRKHKRKQEGRRTCCALAWKPIALSEK